MNAEKQNQQIAETIKDNLGNISDVEEIIVKHNLLQLHVTEAFYRKLAFDRGRGRKIVLALMSQMKILTGINDVTVRIYTQKEKVIEGKVKDWGGDNVTYMYDL